MQYGRRRRASKNSKPAGEINPESLDGNHETQNMLTAYFSSMGGGKARVQMLPFDHPANNYIRKNSDKHHVDWDARIQEGTHYTDIMRLAAQQLFSLNDGIIDTVTKRLTNHNVRDVASAIELARIEWLADRWFKSNLADGTAHKEQESYLAHDVVGRPRPYHTGLAAAIRKELYSLPGRIENGKIRAAMDKFGDEIRAASKTLDQAAALNIAVLIAEFMDWYEEPEPPGGDDVGENDGESGRGSGSGTGQGESDHENLGDITGNNPGDGDGDGEANASPTQEKPEQGSGGSSVSSGPIRGGSGGRTGGQPGAGDSGADVEAQTPPPKVTEAEMRANAEAISKRVVTNMKRTKTRRAKALAEKSQATPNRSNVRAHGYMSYASQSDDRAFAARHDADQLIVPSTPVIVSEHTQMAIQQYMNNRPPEMQLLRRGALARSHAWKLNQGNVKVFRRPPKTRGQVSILVDMSGSMGCWCAKCGKNEAIYTAGSFLAWQVAGALSQIHPTSEVYGFTSIRTQTRATIFPFPSGHMPGECASDREATEARGVQIMGGTPTCTAMLWFKEHIMSRPADTTAIIITDGGPDPCGNGQVSHVEAIGTEMLDSGVKFGTVFIGEGHYINMPTEVSVNISDLGSLSNIQTLLEALDK